MYWRHVFLTATTTVKSQSLKSFTKAKRINLFFIVKKSMMTMIDKLDLIRKYSGISTSTILIQH